MDLVAFLKDFGFPVALCVALLWAVREQNTNLVKAYTDRISTLEGIVTALNARVEELETDRLRRADEYGHTVKDLAGRVVSALREHSELSRNTLNHLRQLTDSIVTRPCLADHEYVPQNPRNPAQHTKVPSSSDLPSDPKEVPTDRNQRHG